MTKDTDFMSELDAATSLKPATPVMIMFFAIVALIVFIILWASFAKVDQVTRGQGQVVPTQEIKYIQSLEGGILQELLVMQGQQVKKGDILLRISDVQFSSEERGMEGKSFSLRAQAARIFAESAGTDIVMPDDIKKKAPQIVKNEMALFESRKRELENAYKILDDRIGKATADIAETQAQISRLAQNRNLLSQELKITQQMVAKRAVPKLEEIRLQRELSDISGQMNESAERKKSLEAELKVTQTERASQEDTFRSQALTELGKVEAEIASLDENLKSIGDRVDRAEMRSPVDGIVNKISLTTIGGVVEPAMKLMEIVPIDSELKITAKVQPNDIGFLKIGQPAKVKITAYDAQIYGSLDGTLVRIGANATPDHEGKMYFEIEVKTDKNHLGKENNPLPISPGMVANVDIITGKRTIMHYLLKPIFKARQNAFTER